MRNLSKLICREILKDVILDTLINKNLKINDTTRWELDNNTRNNIYLKHFPILNNINRNMPFQEKEIFFQNMKHFKSNFVNMKHS